MATETVAVKKTAADRALEKSEQWKRRAQFEQDRAITIANLRDATKAARQRDFAGAATSCEALSWLRQAVKGAEKQP